MTTWTTTTGDMIAVTREAAVFAGSAAMIPVLACLQVTVDASTMTVTATDRYRLGVSTAPVTVGPSEPVTFLVNAKDVAKLKAFPTLDHSKVPTMVRCEVDDDQLRVTAGNDVVSIALYHGSTFPKTASLFENRGSSTGHVIVDPVRLASFAKAKRSKSDTMTIDFGAEGGRIFITVGDHFHGLLMAIKDLGR